MLYINEESHRQLEESSKRQSKFVSSVPSTYCKKMKYTLMAITLLALTWNIEGNPIAKQEKYIRKARQTTFESFNGSSSYFGFPYSGGRVHHRGNGWNASAYELLDRGGNWEAGAGVDADRWRWGLLGRYRSDDFWDFGTRFSYDRDNLRGFLSGTVDSDGGYGFGGGLSFRFKKRSAESVNERFNVTLRADPCNFYAYDLNRDGVITPYEFQIIFGSDEKTKNLFNALSMTTGDVVLWKEEFEAMAARVITDCRQSS